jgi:hypothetical protein
MYGKWAGDIRVTRKDVRAIAAFTCSNAYHRYSLIIGSLLNCGTHATNIGSPTPVSG